MSGSDAQEQVVDAVVDACRYGSDNAEPYELHYLLPVPFEQFPNFFHHDCKDKQNLIIFAKAVFY